MHFSKVHIFCPLNYLVYFDQFNHIKISILQIPMHPRCDDNWYPREIVNRKSGNGVVTI